ncbi:hypothetical protein [Acanthopleuribacter pedis]|uniref:Ankyrin repeat domain-containing protein n=1 Tax=Acanthopleuribacter pedis TaxID=442870 RepID=A0A8J7QSY2_9BACT|nr:hypothetical protein [Acanthopleuribacter pedis]MBO1323168.1 hypothetical protein [Acanthopleuribacter pedis]
MKTFAELIAVVCDIGRGRSAAQADEELGASDFMVFSDQGLHALAWLACTGEAAALRYLLERGADPDQVSTIYGAYQLSGPALMFALINEAGDSDHKVALLKRLLANTKAPNVSVRWREEGQRRYTQRTYAEGSHIQFGMALAKLHKARMDEYPYDPVPRDLFQGVQAMLRELKQAGLTTDAATKAELDALLLQEVAPCKPMDAAVVYQQAITELTVGDRVSDYSDAAQWVCVHYLRNPNFVSCPEWAQLIRHIIDHSLTFEEVAEDLYGEPVSFEDDEGGLCQGWDEHNAFSLLCSILADEAATANPEWADLLVYLLKEQLTYDGYAHLDTIMNACFEQSWFQKHADRDRIKAAAATYL